MKAKKILYYAYYTLMYLPVAVSLAAFSYLPDKIPVHYGYNYQVNRWGSKYEVLIVAAMSPVIGYFTLALAKIASKQEKYGKNNENITIFTGLFTLFLFNAINAFILYAALNKIENLSDVPLDISRLVFGIIGVFMIVMGNYMPKLRRNSFIGLRTRWSRKNDTVWKKCQRIGGISFIIGGVATIGVCIAAKGNTCLISCTAIWFILTVVDVYFTYRVARKD